MYYWDALGNFFLLELRYSIPTSAKEQKQATNSRARAFLLFLVAIAFV